MVVFIIGLEYLLSLESCLNVMKAFFDGNHTLAKV